MFPRKALIVSVLIFAMFLAGTFFTSESFAGDQPLAASENVPLSENTSFWFWSFLGRLHPMMVHFPVSLLVLAAILEIFTIKTFGSRLRPGINVLVAAGAATSILSVVFGLLLARNGDYGTDSLSIHQWTGIATAILGVLCYFFLLKSTRINNKKWTYAYRSVLFVAGIGVCVAGHFGASLTHGSGYLTESLPWSDDYEPTPVNNINFAAYGKDSVKLNEKEERELNVQIRSIFAHNCYKCHGAEKVKGELRLDSKKMAFKGGENGPVIIPGDALNSELFRRINLDADHKDVMPAKGKKLPQGDIELIEFWIKKGAPWPEESGKQDVYRLAKLEPRNPPLPPASNNLQNPVDLWVNEYFKKNKFKWPAPVDDKIYLRRIYLDIIGLLPGEEELNAFYQDTRPDKREIWVRKLLDRNDDYAMHWLTFWNDALRNDYTGTGYITGGRFDITNWLYSSLQTNKPFNLFVKELISPQKESRGFIAGIKWRGVINASQTTEMQAAQNVSQVFFGLNLKCASCHNSFISDWKLEDAYGFANIFADTSLEISRCDKPTGKFTASRMLFKELGYIDSLADAEVKRKQLAENMIRPENGRLYRTMVNRIWAQLMGRGIIEPVDLMDNEAWSQDLLDWMAFNFTQNNTDIRELIYLITTSNTYQLPSTGFKEPNQVFEKDYRFKGMLRKRMSAEQFADAVSAIIAPVFPDSLIKYNPFEERPVEKPVEPKPAAPKKVEAKPEAKTAVLKTPDKKPKDDKSPQAIAAKKKKDAEKALQKKLAAARKAEGKLKAEKLVAEKAILLYPRASLIVNNAFLTALGRPNRETVSTSRESQANLLQALELTNGERFNEALMKGAEKWQKAYRSGDLIIKELYIQALGREPDQKEWKVARQVLGDSPGIEPIQDLFWAIMLLPEFQIIY